MEIRKTKGPAGGQTPLTPASAAESPAGQSGQSGPGPDSFKRQASPQEDAPFWLVRMATDRMAGRQYMSAREHRAAARAEQVWIKQLVSAARPLIAGWQAPGADSQGLAAWQSLVSALCATGGSLFAPPQVVWQPALRQGRGQFLFRSEGGLIQLKPGAPGSAAAWLETVAHETFHHMQQELVTPLYRGDPPIPPGLTELAGYYRDARSIYRPLTEQSDARAHARQALEVGPTAYGAAIAALLKKP